MSKTLTVDEAITVSTKLQDHKKTIVLVGGCFDILHIGHIRFLKAAKAKGEILMVLLESNITVRKLKGLDRPFHSQEVRAEMLTALECVDYVVLLPAFTRNEEYDSLLLSLKPAIIATTKADPERAHKERQAKSLGIILADVIDRLPNKSSSSIAQMLARDL